MTRRKRLEGLIDITGDAKLAIAGDPVRDMWAELNSLWALRDAVKIFESAVGELEITAAGMALFGVLHAYDASGVLAKGD